MMINHFDLFGTRQVWLHLRGRDIRAAAVSHAAAVQARAASAVRRLDDRFWATPTMTVGHLLFAGVLTGYMVLAVDSKSAIWSPTLVEKYEEYRRRVPMFIPRSNTIVTPLSQRALSPDSEGVVTPRRDRFEV